MERLLLDSELEFVSDDFYSGEKDIIFSNKLFDCCGNIWNQEHYSNLILNKSYILYHSYNRKGATLIGEGDPLGYLALFSGNAYRGMGALGCSFSRTKGIGIILEKNLMYNSLLDLGLTSVKLKNMRFKGLTANSYTLVIKIVETVCSTTGEHSDYAKCIGLLGDDDSFIDLSSKWTDCFALDLR